MAPRKSKPRQQQPLSDFELDSDAPIIPQTLPATAPPLTRTNDELNLQVLQRHNSSILSILSIAPYAVLYNFSTSSHTWEKSGVEGTLFVCQLHIQPGYGQERYLVFVLNRRGLENFEFELSSSAQVDLEGEYIILQGQSVDGPGEGIIHGLWIFAEPSPSSTAEMRDINTRLIQDCAARAEASLLAGMGGPAVAMEPLASPSHSQAYADREALHVQESNQMSSHQSSLLDLLRQKQDYISHAQHHHSPQHALQQYHSLQQDPAHFSQNQNTIIDRPNPNNGQVRKFDRAPGADQWQTDSPQQFDRNAQPPPQFSGQGNIWTEPTAYHQSPPNSYTQQIQPYPQMYGSPPATGYGHYQNTNMPFNQARQNYRSTAGYQ